MKMFAVLSVRSYGSFSAFVAVMAFSQFTGCGRHIGFSFDNKSDSLIDSVTVFITGREYNVGQVSAQERVEIQIMPESESHIEIQYVENGLSKIQVIDCYLEPGYSGRIEAVLLNDGKLTHSSDVRPLPRALSWILL